MTIQTIEISGERYVIISERDFLRLRGQTGEVNGASAAPARDLNQPVFKEIEPLRIAGEPASETLIRDRR
jgi:hypothetical protein